MMWKEVQKQSLNFKDINISVASFEKFWRNYRYELLPDYTHNWCDEIELEKERVDFGPALVEHHLSCKWSCEPLNKVVHWPCAIISFQVTDEAEQEISLLIAPPFADQTWRGITWEPNFSEQEAKTFFNAFWEFMIRKKSKEALIPHIAEATTHTENTPQRLPHIDIMRKYYADYSAETAKEILDALPRAYNLFGKEGGRWGPGKIAKIVGLRSETISRYLKAFREVEITEWEGVPLP